MSSRFYDSKSTNLNWLFKDTKEQIKTIKQLSLKESAVDCSSLKNFKSVGSYNWSPKSTPEQPIMVIPGEASRLVGNLDKQQLRKSSYEQMCDENRFYMSDYPMEPLFRAVSICSPDFDFNAIDIATDRNNLRKLLEFVEDTRKESFRIDFQKIDNLIVFIRNEENAKQFCDDYGKDFEHRFTNDSGENGSYRQIVTYKLGDLKILTRFEVDCIEETSELVEEGNQDDVLVSAMSSIKLDVEKKEKLSMELSKENSKLTVIKSGCFNSKHKKHFVEMTTKSVFRGNFEFPQSKWNQLFFSNTDVLLIGWHSRGMLQKIEKLSFSQVTQRSGREKRDIQVVTSKLNDLLTKLKVFASKDCNDQQIYSIIFHRESNENSIEIFSTSNKTQCLPQSLLEKLFNFDFKDYLLK